MSKTMTFAAGKKTTTACSRSVSVAAGFTLWELVLALSILVLLAGLAVIGFAPFRARELDLGAERMATVVRMARAEAAKTGRTLRLGFSEETNEILLEVETETEDGRLDFREYTACSWLHLLPNEYVRVESCRLTGPGAYRTIVLETQTDALDESTLQPITFYADGSCDSADIELASRRAREQRRVLLRVNGLNGTIETQSARTEEQASTFGGNEL